MIPSLSISVNIMAHAPLDSARRAKSLARMFESFVHPSIDTLPFLASIPTAILFLNNPDASSKKSIFFSAFVPSTILSIPQSTNL